MRVRTRFKLAMSSNDFWNLNNESKPDVQKISTTVNSFSHWSSKAPKPRPKVPHGVSKPKPKTAKGNVSSAKAAKVSGKAKMSGATAVQKIAAAKIKQLKGISAIPVQKKRKKAKKSFDTSEEDESAISGMVTSANEEGNNSTHCEEKLIRIGAIGGGLEDALLDETALDDLIHMQQQEILELVAERRVFDIHDDVQPGLYTQQFQTKVAEYLLDGGKTSTASKRLNIPLEALKAWKLKLIESTKRKKKNGKPKRDKVGVPTQVNIRHYAAVAAPRSSVPKPKKPKVVSHETKKSVGRPKFSLGSKEPANINVMSTRGSRRQKNESGGAPAGDMAKTKPTKPMSTNGSTLGVEKSMDVMEVMPLGGEGCNDEFFLILDKGASELSSDEAPEPYPESLLMDRRNQIEQQKAQSRVSLFVCNKCREIFRCSVSLLNHEKMCKMFRPVPFV